MEEKDFIFVIGELYLKNRLLSEKIGELQTELLELKMRMQTEQTINESEGNESDG